MVATILRFDTSHATTIAPVRHHRKPQRKPIKRTIFRLKRKKIPPRTFGVCRVGLFESDGTLVEFYGRAFDAGSSEDRIVLRAACKAWGKHKFRKSYLGLIQIELDIFSGEAS